MLQRFRRNQHDLQSHVRNVTLGPSLFQGTFSGIGQDKSWHWHHKRNLLHSSNLRLEACCYSELTGGLPSLLGLPTPNTPAESTELYHTLSILAGNPVMERAVVENTIMH